MHSESRPMAVALGYKAELDPAPKVLASGKGELARRILEIAENENIPIICEPILARALIDHVPGEMIPVELYQAVAELLAYIYRKQGRI